MSNAHIIQTGKLSDNKIVLLLEAIEEAFGKTSSNVHLGTLAVDYTSEENKKLFNKKNQKSITRADIHTAKHKFHVKYRRGTSPNVNDHETRQPSQYLDEIIIVLGAQTGNGRDIANAQEVIDCTNLIEKFVSNTLPSNVDNSAQNATELLQAQMTKQNDLYQEMLVGIDARRAELDKEHDDRMKLLEKQTDDRLKEIEAQKAKNEESHSKQVEKLNEREAALDDRDHMHVRREQREQINNEVKQRLKETIVPASASIKRWTVFLMAISASVFLGFASYKGMDSLDTMLASSGGVTQVVGGEQVRAPSLLQQMPEAFWFILIKTLLSSIGTIVFLFYAITWLRQLYLDDVKTQREMERYAYDINRASWAIETIMEMKTTKEAAPPDAWIDATCRNLFDSRSNDDENRIHPIEAILSSSAKVEFGPDGAKFELGKKGARQLAKKVSNSG